MHDQSTSSTTSVMCKLFKVTAMVLAISVVAACNNKKENEAKTGQSVVRVNDDEITIHQINNELVKANIAPAQQKLAIKQITSGLIERQLLTQEAAKTQIDRSPKVMQDIENAKTQIIAKAYLENKLAALPKLTDSEISDFRNKQPEIFANRMIYMMDELRFAYSGNGQDIKTLSDTAKTLEDVSGWLNTHQIKFQRTRATHAAESLPSTLLAKLATLKAGDLVFIGANDGIVVGLIVDKKSAPIGEAQSKPIIERILTEQKQKAAIAEEVKRLRAAAKIEFLNKDYELNNTATAEAPQESAVVKQNKPETVIEGTLPSSDKKTERYIENGLSGL
jgi:peptidyl-prolyl cis-trans isomerase C